MARRPKGVSKEMQEECEGESWRRMKNIFCKYGEFGLVQQFDVCYASWLSYRRFLVIHHEGGLAYISGMVNRITQAKYVLSQC